MAGTPEGAVKRNIKSVLVTAGAYFFMPVQNGYGADTVDYLGFRKGDGRGFAVEAKAPGKEPTARQRKRLRAVLETGAAAFVLDGDLRDMRAFTIWLTDCTMGRDSHAEQMIQKWDIYREEEPIA